MNKQYQIIQRHWILEDFDERYFDHGFELFEKRLRHFKQIKRKLTEAEEKELRFMLEALIEAKNHLNDEYKKNQP